MDIGICTPVTNAQTVAHAGGDYVEENIQNHLRPNQGDDAEWESLAMGPWPRPVLAANCFLPKRLPCVGPDVDRTALIEYGQVACRRAGHAGIRYLVFGSGGARTYPEGFAHESARSQFVELLAELGPIAEQEGVSFVVEPLQRGECNLVNTVDEGAEVVREVDHPHVRLLVDVFHMLRNDETPDAIARHADLVVHAHIAEKAERTPPGVAGDDFTPFLKALLDGGYAGAMSIEAQFSDLTAQAGPAIAELRRQLAAVSG